MENKKAKIYEVICAYTAPEMWNAVRLTNTAVQANGSADAEYIAFIRLGLEKNNGRGVITHYAKVKPNGIKSYIPIFDYAKRVPGLEEYYKKRSWSGVCKTYDLEWIKELPSLIYHREGDSPRSQRYFSTTLEELLKAKVLSDMKTISQLKNKK